MLFLDDSCFSAEQTLQRQFKQGIPQLLGSDWFGIMSLTPKGRARIEASISLHRDGDPLALSFVEQHAPLLLEQDYPFRLFSSSGGWEYVLFPIRITEKGYRVFTFHGRCGGHYDRRDIQWYTIFAEAAYGRVVLQNQYIQEANYVNSILDSTADLIMVLDEGHHIISQNDAAREFWGGDPSFADTVYRTVRDGEQLLKTIESVRVSGARSRMNNVVVTQKGDDHILDLAISPLCNSKSQIPGVVLVGTDVTQQQFFDYQFEQFKYHVQLGEISLGLSHDIKNPLMNISNCASLLKKDRGISERSREVVGLISSEVKRIDNIIDQMLSFGNVAKQAQSTQLDLNEVLRNCIQMVNRQKIFRDIEISSDLDEQIPIIRAKSTDMQQIFLNILINAQQAITDDGSIFVRSRYCPEEKKIAISVVDNGVGLQGVDTEQLFSPYYTTKENGSGLGLFMAKRSLEPYKGTISLRTGEDGLTICSIELPTPV